MARRPKPGFIPTEAHWRAVRRPHGMLRMLRGCASERKLRLIGVACCRRIARLFAAGEFAAALDVAECHADGLAGDEELKAAGTQVQEALGRLPVHPSLSVYESNWLTPELCAGRAVAALLISDYPRAVRATVTSAFLSARARANLDPLSGIPTVDRAAVEQVEEADRAALFRDIMGNPFCPAAVDPAWRTATVVSLAEAAYQEQTLPSGELETLRMSILADALEDAGCDDADLLGHLRSPGPHVRGCWALDVLLARR